MTKFLKIVLLLFLFSSLKGENYSSDDYQTIPDVFTNQVKLSFLVITYFQELHLSFLFMMKKQVC